MAAAKRRIGRGPRLSWSRLNFTKSVRVRTKPPVLSTSSSLNFAICSRSWNDFRAAGRSITCGSISMSPNNVRRPRRGTVLRPRAVLTLAAASIMAIVGAGCGGATPTAQNTSTHESRAEEVRTSLVESLSGKVPPPKGYSLGHAECSKPIPTSGVAKAIFSEQSNCEVSFLRGAETPEVQFRYFVDLSTGCHYSATVETVNTGSGWAKPEPAEVTELIAADELSVKGCFTENGAETG